jgi:hypothetical protein
LRSTCLAGGIGRFMKALRTEKMYLSPPKYGDRKWSPRPQCSMSTVEGKRLKTLKTALQWPPARCRQQPEMLLFSKGERGSCEARLGPGVQQLEYSYRWLEITWFSALINFSGRSSLP